MLIVVLQWHNQVMQDPELVAHVRRLMRGGFFRARMYAEEFTTIELWRMWGRTGRLRLASEKKLARSQVLAALRAKGLCIRPGKPLTVSCPAGADPREIRWTVRDAIWRSGVHHKIARTIQVRVVKAKAKTGQQMLTNHMVWIKRMQTGGRLKCT